MLDVPTKSFFSLLSDKQGSMFSTLCATDPVAEANLTSSLSCKMPCMATRRRAFQAIRKACATYAGHFWALI